MRGLGLGLGLLLRVLSTASAMVSGKILMETGDKILMESGDFILLEG